MFNTVIKPIGERCNLSCDYCFYRGNNINQNKGVMSDSVLERLIKNTIDSTRSEQVDFCWQGGEPTLCGLEFYKKVISLQRRHNTGKIINNSIQTNGMVLSNEWCNFFKEHDFLVGISVDGPASIHDIHRKNSAGKGSLMKTIRGVELLKQYGINFNVLSVISDASEGKGKDIYHFLTQELDAQHMQFIPAVHWESSGRILSPFSVTSKNWGQTITEIFFEWIKKDIGCRFIQLFENILAVWCGDLASLCTMQTRCGSSLMIEKGGDVYSCDHFSSSNDLLGNIIDSSLEDLFLTEKQQSFALTKCDYSSQCKECKWKTMCHGGCPAHRVETLKGHKHNYLCNGYIHIFESLSPYMDILSELILTGHQATDFYKYSS